MEGTSKALVQQTEGRRRAGAITSARKAGRTDEAWWDAATAFLQSSSSLWVLAYKERHSGMASKTGEALLLLAEQLQARGEHIQVIFNVQLSLHATGNICI